MKKILFVLVLIIIIPARSFSLGVGTGDVVTSPQTLDRYAIAVRVELNIGETLERMLPNPQNLLSLEILGTSLTLADFTYIRYKMPNLKFLDISKTEVTAIPDNAFSHCRSLVSIILPNNCGHDW